MKSYLIIAIIIILNNDCKAQQWDAMNGGVTYDTTKGVVLSILNYQNKITIAGGFKNSGNTILNSVSQWDGNQWTPMGIGCWGWGTDPWADVQSMGVFHNKLYAGGWIRGSGGNIIGDSAHISVNLTKWDGIDWSPFTHQDPNLTGIYGVFTNSTEVYAFQEYHNNLYIGGMFTQTNDYFGIHNTKEIAKWNDVDTSFSSVGVFSGSFYPQFTEFTNTFTIYNDKLIAGGSFTTIDGNPISAIASWNDTAWSALGSGLNSTVFSSVVFNGDLYVAGQFTATGDGLTSLNHIAKWDGTQWSAVGEGLNDWIYKLYVDSTQNKLYAGGRFIQTGLGVTAKHIAEWNGTNWVEVGGGADDLVVSFYAKDSNLYIGGYFTHVGNGIPANAIARWGPSHVGVDDISASSTTIQLEIYPNPSNGEFTIESTSKIESIKVFNILGETIYQTTKDNLQASINLSSHPKGIYFVQVKTEKGILNRKIVIQ